MKIILQSKFLFACLYAAGIEKHVGMVRDNSESSPTQRYSECDFVTKRWSPQYREKNIVGFIKGPFNVNQEEGEEGEEEEKEGGGGGGGGGEEGEEERGEE